jgi:hypothetical protein
MDNLPNPGASPGNPYVPTNGPAIGDMMDYFNFSAPPNVAVLSLPPSPVVVNPLS